MKKIFSLTAMALLVTAAGHAQESVAMARHDKHMAKTELKGVRKEDREVKRADRKLEVNYSTRQSFAVDFPKSRDVEFMRGENFDEVVFNSEGHHLRAFYDTGGMLVGTTEHLSFSDLPAAAQKKIHTKYRNYMVKDVFLFDDNEADQTDMILYNNSFSDTDTYFVELAKGTRQIVVSATPRGEISYFTRLK